MSASEATQRPTGSREAVLLLHGALSDDRTWESYAPILKGEGFDPILPGMDGFYPRHFAPEKFSSANHIAALSMLLNQLPSPVHVVGHSRGARLALTLVTMNATRVRSLTLIEPGGTMESGFFTLGTYSAPKLDFRPVIEALAEGDHALAARLYINAGHGEATWESLSDRSQQIAADNALTLRGTLGDDTIPLSRQTAQCVQCPTLLLEGSESPEMFRQIGNVLQNSVPDCQRIILEGANHFEVMRKPDRVAKLLADFMAQSGIVADRR